MVTRTQQELFKVVCYYLLLAAGIAAGVLFIALIVLLMAPTTGAH